MNDISQRIAGLSPEKRALLLKRLGMDKKAQNPDTIPAIADRAGDFPLSFSQQRLWFLQQLEGAGEAYHISLAFQLEGRFDVAIFRRCIETLVARHESLRTVFREKDGVPVQNVTEARARIDEVDLRHVGEDERETEVLRLAAEEARRPFDLSADLLLRAQVLALGAEDHVILLTMHHIVSDGWSLGVLMRDFVLLYKAYSRGQASPLAPLPIQYADFAAWQRQHLAGPRLERQLNFWKRNLADLPALLELPTDHPRPAVQTYRGSSEPLVLSKELTQRLAVLAREQDATLFIILLTVFQILLGRYARTNDVAVGSPIANRTRREVEDLIGLFVNTLVLRTRFEDCMGFRDLLSQVRQHVMEAHDHQDVPFEQLVDVLQPVRNTAHTPLFQVMFILQNAPDETDDLEGLKLSIPKREHKVSKFDMSLSMSETSDGLRGSLEYSTDLWEAASIKRFLAHFEVLLQAVVADPDQRVADLPLLSADERDQLLASQAETRSAYREDVFVHQLFEERVAATPDRPALTFAGRTMSYGELNAAAETLADHLAARGITTETPVAVYLERGPNLVIALLAVLKAGGCYIPIDPFYPEQRIRYVLEDAQPALVLTQTSLRGAVPTALTALCLDATPNHDGEGTPAPRPRRACHGEQLAYTIYTSGSTGRPKGVQIPHRALANFLHAMQRELPIDEADTLLAVTSMSFDIAVLELFLPLSLGAGLVLARKEDTLDGGRMLGLIQNHRITAMQATPSGWRLLLEGLGERKLPGLKALCGGEALPGALAGEMLAHGFSLFNLYGPTETTIWSACHPVVQSDGGTVSIGRAIANTQLYIVDKHLNLMPAGAPGELFIGGDGLARGYRGQPAMTADRFRPDPFSNRPGARIYWTGDLSRTEPSGNLAFLGRVDFQVKIRGFRIELGEIESRLEAHDQVVQAAVVVHQNGERETDKRLVAYLVAGGDEPDAAELKRFLAESLPEYMVPTAFIPLTEMPLTPNGKLDRKALPEPDRAAAPAVDYVAPGSEAEQKLVAIWQDVLGLDRIGIHNNFFDLGGHSLLLARVHAAIRKAFPKPCSLLDLFRYTTISALAEYLTGMGGAEPGRNLALDRAQRQRAAAMKQRRQLVRRPRVERTSK